jgi:hypothetical protein
MSDPQDHAGGNLALIYRHARDSGVLPLIDELITLSGPPQGATLLEQLADMARKGARIDEIRTQLGMVVDPQTLAASPDIAEYSRGFTLRVLDHYVRWGNIWGRQVNETGQVLARWQPPANNWSDLHALAYIASHADLMDAFGANPDAARAHWNNHGRWEGRGAAFDVDAYLASRPDVRAAAVASLSADQGSVVSRGGTRGGSYVDVQLPEQGGVRLYFSGTDENTGERVYAGSDGNDGYVRMTESQIYALAAPAAPSDDAIREFAVKHYIAHGRFEMPQAA